MSENPRVIALELAVRHNSTATSAEIVTAAQAFHTFLTAETAVKSTRRRAADAAPVESVAVSTPADETAIETPEADALPLKAEVEKAAAAVQEVKAAVVITEKPADATVVVSTMTPEAFKIVLGKAASTPTFGPLKVREVLGKFTNPTTGAAAVNFTTLHPSHYAPAAALLQAALAA